MSKKKREFVFDFRIVVEGDDAQDLFDCLGGTIESVRDSLSGYGRVEVFKLRERKVKEIAK